MATKYVRIVCCIAVKRSFRTAVGMVMTHVNKTIVDGFLIRDRFFRRVCMMMLILDTKGCEGSRLLSMSYVYRSRAQRRLLIDLS